MTEREFINFYKERNYSKNYKEAKEKIDLFWDVLLIALEEDKEVVFKSWGKFEKKEVKSRKAIIPKREEVIYTKPKEVIKFKAGLDFLNAINKKSDEDE